MQDIMQKKEKPVNIYTLTTNIIIGLIILIK